MSTRILKNIFSFEFLFTLWFFSYQYKNAASFFIRIDITLLLSLGMIAYVGNKTYKRLTAPESNLTSLYAFLLMSAWWTASFFWSSSHILSTRKIAAHLLFNTLGFLCGFSIIGLEKTRVKRFLILASSFSVLVSCYALWTFTKEGVIITEILGANYLVSGMTIGAGILLLNSFAFSHIKSENFLKISYVYMLLMVIITAMMYLHMNLGGRGPVYSLFTCLFLWGLFACSKVSGSRQYILLHTVCFITFCVGTGLLLNFLFQHDTPHFAQRTQSIFAPGMKYITDEPVNLRLSYYKSAYSAIIAHPFQGIGIGGWPLWHGLADIEWHPHNIFLEIASETGIIGLGFFLYFLYTVFCKIWKVFKRSSPSYQGLFFVILFYAFESLKSGDINDNYGLFALFGVLASYKKREY